MGHIGEADGVGVRSVWRQTLHGCLGKRREREATEWFVTHMKNVALARPEEFVQYFQEKCLKPLCNFLTCVVAIK